MKVTKFAYLMVVGLALTLGAAGCKKNPYGVTPLPGSRAGSPAEAGPGGMIGGGTNTSEAGVGSTGIPSNVPGAHEGWLEDREVFKQDTVYFDYDSSVVLGSQKPKVKAVADYLKSHGANAVLIEGHCDERGTEEYNRALGVRRAQALREELVKEGVAASRVDTISYGKDRPADPGNNEAAWKKNRRGEFVLLTEPAK